MKAKNALNASGANFSGANVHIGDVTKVRVVKGRKTPATYPEGCIGADISKRNYVKYLVERYNRYREADASFGRTGRFHYAVLFKNIETKFKASTYFIPESRFGELVDYLHDRIDNTILGRRNHSRGIPNFESFDEYVMQHMQAPSGE